MDYEFRRNTLDDSFHCEFSMGHEAIGYWLLDEIGTDEQALTEVILQIEKIIATGGEWQKAGRSFHLWLDRDEAIIQANHLYEEMELELDEGLDNAYDDESTSSCGPEDLLAVLHAWQDFLARYGKKTFSIF